MTLQHSSSPQKKLVAKGESLWRRIVESWIIAGDGSMRPSSAAFKGTNISVDIASKTTAEQSIKNAAALAGFASEVPINLGYVVVEDPVEGNCAHAIIEGKITRSKARIIAHAAIWVIPPSDAGL